LFLSLPVAGFYGGLCFLDGGGITACAFKGSVSGFFARILSFQSSALFVCVFFVFFLSLFFSLLD
jgi:hypothetical protein